MDVERFWRIGGPCKVTSRASISVELIDSCVTSATTLANGFLLFKSTRWNTPEILSNVHNVSTGAPPIRLWRNTWKANTMWQNTRAINAKPKPGQRRWWDFTRERFTKVCAFSVMFAATKPQRLTTLKRTRRECTIRLRSLAPIATSRILRGAGFCCTKKGSISRKQRRDLYFVFIDNALGIISREDKGKGEGMNSWILQEYWLWENIFDV